MKPICFLLSLIAASCFLHVTAVRARGSDFLANGKSDVSSINEKHHHLIDDDADIDTDGAIISPSSDDPTDEDFCYGEVYRKRTLKVIKEIPFIGLFRDLKNFTRFEASGTCIVNDAAYVVFDSLRTVGRVSLGFNFRGAENVLIPELDEPERESQFEGLAYSPLTDTFIVVKETHLDDDEHTLLSKTEEIKFAADASSFSVVRECVVDFEFEDVNKGFEGIYYFDKDGKRMFMGLCESNYCKTIQGDDAPGLDRGHGRVVVAEMVEDEETGCSWKVVKTIKIPRRAKFLDYSAMSFLGYMGKTVAITSQEDAAVWLGEFDWEELEFVGRGRTLHFPRSETCEKVYCNVEGIQWIDAHRVVLTSDKSKATQPHSCMHKDQMITIMALGNY